MGSRPRTPLYWIASSLKDLKAMPVPVQKTFGTTLRDVQHGDTPKEAKALSGFDGGSVLELVEDHDRSTYRAVYTVRFAGAVYVLHVFQKKSRKGIKTPKEDVDLIKLRLKRAREHYETLPREEDRDE